MNRTTFAAAAICLLCASSAAGAQTRSGGGEGAGIRVGSELVSVVRTFSGADTIVHLRNVGPQPATFDVIPRCAEPASDCTRRSNVVVAPVATTSDGSRDAVLVFRGVSLADVQWTVRLATAP